MVEVDCGLHLRGVMAVTEGLSMLKTKDVRLGPALVGKKVGQVQFVYLLFLLGQMFWLKQGWAVIADHGIFALLAVLIPINIFDYGRRLVDMMTKAPLHCAEASTAFWNVSAPANPAG